MLKGAKALQEGRAPEAPKRAKSYALRSGGSVAPAGLAFEDVMKQRFGTATGIVP
jgi:hypothetical protein